MLATVTRIWATSIGIEMTFPDALKELITITVQKVDILFRLGDVRFLKDKSKFLIGQGSGVNIININWSKFMFSSLLPEEITPGVRERFSSSFIHAKLLENHFQGVSNEDGRPITLE